MPRRQVLPVEKADLALNPVRLIIPAIDINASVEDVGTQANADLATPSQNPWLDVGWYNLGPQPGERGSAVIDGHLDRPGGFQQCSGIYAICTWATKYW